MARIYRFGDVEIDLEGFRLLKAGKPVPVEPKALNLLVFLVQNPGRMVGRRELIDAVWSDAFVTDHVLNRAIGQLRKLLADDPKEPRYIETVPTLGYRFIAGVVREGAETPAPAGATDQKTPSSAGGQGSASWDPSPSGQVSLTRRKGRWVIGALALVLVLVVGVAAAWVLGYRPHRFGRSSIRSLAVLPLENLSGDASQEYLADGMTGELITSLGQIGELRVISQATAMQYKNAHKPLPQIARELNVDAVIDGSVQRAGDRLRVVAQLVDGEDDKQLWAQTYDGNLSDVLGLENQVSTAVADQIRVKLTSTEQTQLANSQTVNPQAYEAFQKGEFYFEVNSTASAQTSLNYFQRAVALDPNFARAWVGIGRSYNFLGEEAVTYSQALNGADAAVAKALQLQPNLAEAYAERGWTELYYHWDFPGTERDFRHALDLDPNSADAHEGLADYFTAMGRFDDGILELKRALELDPNSPMIFSEYCLTLNYERRYDEAAAECSQALQVDPNYQFALFIASQVYFNKRDFEMAHKMWHRLGVDDPDYLAMLDEVNGAPGKKGAFDHWSKEQKEPPDPFYFALMYAGLGRKDQAFDSLEKAFAQRQHPHALTWIPMDPRVDSLRSDPRFDVLLRRVGLPPQPPELLAQIKHASGH
jgi:TolB-like protein/DNA-binding winged helix-turn-helix (wHTH) protein/Flp pilus assembly protein TadD